MPASTDQAEKSTRIATMDIAPYGDVVLELSSDSGIAQIRVASQVLCAASPVFRAMLGPTSSFKEACELRTVSTAASTKLEPYKLKLEDDSPEALTIILLALHCQNTQVPKHITPFERLLDLAIICDKYDCADGVSLWADIWMSDWKAKALDSGYEQWLFIAWTFGAAGIFESLSKKIIMEGHYGLDPTLFMTKGRFCIDEIPVPRRVIEVIRERRGAAIQSMADSTLSYQERYLKPWGKSLCKASPQLEVCDAAILGSIIMGFRSLGLVPDFGEFILKSIEGMERGIKELRIEFIDQPAAMIHCPYCGTQYTGARPSGGAQLYCTYGYCGRNFTAAMSSHGDTCNFLPELQQKISTAVGGVKGLILKDFKGEAPAANAEKWDLLEYK